MSLPLGTNAGVPNTLMLPPPQLPPMGPNYGALLVGTFLSLILFGVELHQMYRYTRLFGSDPSYMKYYVAVLFVLDTFHTVICMHSSYWYLVTNYFNPINLGVAIWSLNMQAISMGLLIVAVQIYYARRVYLLNRKFKPIVAIVAILCLTELGFASELSAFTAQGFILGSVELLKGVVWLQSCAFGVVIVIDVTLTSVLTVSLHRIRTGFKGSDDKIDVLIAYTMCTGLLTNFIAIACFVLSRIAPGEMLFAAADMVYAKVYINSVLAAMNTRGSSLGGDGPPAQEIELSDHSHVKHSTSNLVNAWTSPSGENGTEHSTILDIKVKHDIGGHV